MPGFDGTGPRGMGPMTGRGMGPCARGSGMGFGRGFGRGMGFGRRMNSQPVVLTEAEEKKILEAQLKEIEAEKAEIQKRLAELK
ncbi:DUF5320 domain-containing protein [Candidatus Woesearchaeota archaeon]|nr:DUF5320 domain-containing protein [Candidatus Woesearchaeota archaeon]